MKHYLIILIILLVLSSPSQQRCIETKAVFDDTCQFCFERQDNTTKGEYVPEIVNGTQNSDEVYGFFYCVHYYDQQKKKNKLLDQYECMNVCCFDAKYPNKPQSLFPVCHDLEVQVFIDHIFIIVLAAFTIGCLVSVGAMNLCKYVRQRRLQRQIAAENANNHVNPSQNSITSMNQQCNQFDDYKFCEHYQNRELQEEFCCICLQVNVDTITACGHYFHWECLTLWYKKKNICPLCNSQGVYMVGIYCRKCSSKIDTINLRQLYRLNPDLNCKLCSL